MLTAAPLVYDVPDPAEARLMSGRKFLQAILDARGRILAHGTSTLMVLAGADSAPA